MFNLFIVLYIIVSGLFICFLYSRVDLLTNEILTITNNNSGIGDDIIEN